MTYSGFKDKIMSTLTLLASCSTLLCCALPALFVALGAGSVMVSLIRMAPGLVVVSEHKKIVFIFAGAMLALSACMQWRSRRMACPIDRAQAEACSRLRKYSAIVFGISLIAYLTGLFFAYFAGYFVT